MRRRKQISEAASVQELERCRVEFLGKKGTVTELLKGLKDLPIEERKVVGSEANALKNELTMMIEEKKKSLEFETVDRKLREKGFDITLPAKRYDIGSLSPITIVQKEIEEIFTGLGFVIVGGPEVESDYYNFEALNIPKNHPARDMQDTYWLDNGQLMRTHTSPCQVRAMQKYGAPLKIIAPGRCFRNENIDASHENTFFQLEGMMIDTNISIANLIYVMKLLLTEVFKREVDIRLRPGFFPFVEPGFELDSEMPDMRGKVAPLAREADGWRCFHVVWFTRMY